MENFNKGRVSGAMTNKGREMTEIGFFVSLSSALVWSLVRAHPANPAVLISKL